ncbi:glycosyltransferase family 2 protein [bacterium]|nr:MAG: glycosyltransferase family 2 protein [bacterium]
MVKGMLVALYLLALLAFMLAVRYQINRKWPGADCRPERSLILVVRNRQEMIEGILRRAIQVRNGNAIRIELIVIDNGSRDETPGIIAKLARSPGGFTFINAAADYGSRDVIEIGLEMSRGEKICYLGLKKSMTLHDTYNSLDEVMIRNPSGNFLPRQYFIDRQEQNRTQVPAENKTWGGW